MGDFTAVPDLENIVAHMVAPEVRKVALKVAVQARRLAPPGKRWVSMSDNDVRDTHREAHRLSELPANLRFAVRGQPWDIVHGLSPGIDYLLEPKDTSTGLPLDSVQHVHCRCVLALNPTALSSRIKTGPAHVTGPMVTVAVTCTHAQVLGAEYGDVYGEGIVSPGTHFMGRAAARVAGTGGYGKSFDPQKSLTGGGVGGEDN